MSGTMTRNPTEENAAGLASASSAQSDGGARLQAAIGARARGRAGRKVSATGPGARPARRAARGLGWFSVALGVAELSCPRAMAAWLGIARCSGLIRAYGAREIANGVGILAQGGKAGAAPWVWARVAGDAVNIATLSCGLGARSPRRRNAAGALGAVAVLTALDVVCALALTRAGIDAALREAVPANDRFRF